MHEIRTSPRRIVDLGPIASVTVIALLLLAVTSVDSAAGFTIRADRIVALGARSRIECSPGESVVGNLFNPASGATAFVACIEKGLSGDKANLQQWCYVQTPSDPTWVPFSLPPNPPTEWPREFLGIGTTVLMPGDRDYGSDQTRFRADCQSLAARVPKIVTRELANCLYRTAVAGGPDYVLCEQEGRARHRELYYPIVAMGCFGGSSVDSDAQFALLARCYRGADERARASVATAGLATIARLDAADTVQFGRHRHDGSGQMTAASSHVDRGSTKPGALHGACEAGLRGREAGPIVVTAESNSDATREVSNTTCTSARPQRAWAVGPRWGSHPRPNRATSSGYE